MCEMTLICGKLIKICGNWFKYLTNGLNMWVLTQRSWEIATIFVKWLSIYGTRLKSLRPKYLGNGLDTCSTA